MKGLIVAMVLGLFCASQAFAAQSLEDTVNSVLRNHQSLKEIQENKDALKWQLEQAKAGFGPSVTISGGGGGILQSNQTTRMQDLDKDFYGIVNASARLVQPIWDGFATRSRVRTAKANLGSINARVFDTATSLALDGIIAHIDLIRQREIYESTRKNIEEHEKILGQTEKRVDVGVDTRGEKSQAQSRLARAQSTFAEVNASLDVAEDTYRRLTGVSANDILHVDMPMETFSSADMVYSKALEHNPKLAAYAQDINAARGEEELAQSNFYPKFQAEAGYAWSDTGGNSDRWQYTIDARATGTWNIFNSGADLAGKKAAQSRTRQAGYVMDNFSDDLKLDIQSTWANLEAAREQEKYSKNAVEYARNTLSAYIEQFHIGNRSLLDVLDAMNELYSSSVQYETAKANILIGSYRLCALTGNLLPVVHANMSYVEEPMPSVKANMEKPKGLWFN